jgi:hypothetical protein
MTRQRREQNCVGPIRVITRSSRPRSSGYSQYCQRLYTLEARAGRQVTLELADSVRQRPFLHSYPRVT